MERGITATNGRVSHRPSTRIGRVVLWLLAGQLTVCLYSSGCRRVRLPEPAPAKAIEISGRLERNLTERCVANPQAGFDYFPDKAEIRHARQFQVRYAGNHKIVEFQPAVRTQETIRYILVQCGTPVPADVKDAVVVRIPAFRCILDDPSYGSSIVQINALDHLIGVNSVLPYSEPSILERIKEGRIAETGSQGHSTIEALLAADPDLIFPFYSAYPQHNLHPKVRDMGIPAVPLASHFEPTPLARAEWIKFVALFFNREREAEAVFTEAEREYTRLTHLTGAITKRPAVMLGFPSDKETWGLNGGGNFMARLIADAGGRYFWQDGDARSLIAVNFERVFDLSLETAFWFGHYFTGPTMKSVTNGDPRLAYFNPVVARQVYSPRKVGGPRQRILYRDQSLDHPQWALADLIHILHPELIPGHQPFFFRRLE
jgi:iron complex transport system substrate-binding protein